MQSHFSFHLMSIEFHLRDWLRPPARILQAAGLRPGMQLLDFGCGPGGFSAAAAELVGLQGRVWAVDIHPLALEAVAHMKKRKKADHVQAVSGDRLGIIPEKAIDMALLYDVLHDLPDPGAVMNELHKRLKPKGILSVSDHHLKPDKIVAVISGSGLYRLCNRTRWSHQFEKIIPRTEP